MSNLYLNCIDNDTTLNKKNYLLRAAKRIGFDKFVLEANYVKDPDFVLNIDPFKFVQGKIWTGMWVIDTLLQNPFTFENALNMDTIFIAGTTQRNLGIHFAPDKEMVLFQAVDPEYHKATNEPPEFDFVSCGSTGTDPYNERARCLQIMGKNFKGKEFSKNRSLEEYVKILNKAKVQFIRSMKVGHEGEIAQRFFECLAIGPVLTNYVSDLELTGLVEGEDYLAYHSDIEMVAKMKSLLDDEEYRKAVARNGRRKALLHHTYEARLVGIISHLRDWGFEIPHA